MSEKKEKTCWMCKRTEAELKIFEMYDEIIKDRWVEGLNYSGLVLCPICRDFMTAVSIEDEEQKGFIDWIEEVFFDNILPILKIKHSFSLEVDETEGRRKRQTEELKDE